MKKIKLLTLLFITLIFSSCLVDDDVISDAYGDSPNLAGFVDRSTTISGVTNGDEYEYELNMEVKGPSLLDLTGDVNVTVSVDPSSTAIEGYHFRLNSNSLTLKKFEESINREGDFYVISMKMSTPESTVIVLESK